MKNWVSLLINNYKKLTNNQEDQSVEIQKGQSLQQQLVYQECPQNGDHTGELLNLVCLENTCRSPEKIMLCCICQEQTHQGHSTKPLKNVLHDTDTLIKSQKDAKSNKIFNKQQLLSEIEKQKQISKETLDQTKNQFLAAFEQLDLEMVNYFQNISEQIESKQIGEIDLESLLTEIYQNQSDLIKLTDLLKKLLEVAPERQQPQKTMDSNELLSLLVTSGKENISSLKSMEDQLKKIVDDQKSLFQQKQRINIFEAKIEFTFSSQFKHPSVNLINSTTAKVAATGQTGYKFAILGPSLETTFGRKIKFGFKMKAITDFLKIKLQEVSSSNWIAVGVCHMNTIVNKNYTFSFSSLGHGGYLISSNGGSWSTIKSQANNLVKAFKFTKNDTIYCSYDPIQKVLTFSKAKSTETYKLDFQLTSDPLHPCALFYYNNDEVEFLNPHQIQD